MLEDRHMNRHQRREQGTSLKDPKRANLNSTNYARLAVPRREVTPAGASTPYNAKAANQRPRRRVRNRLEPDACFGARERENDGLRRTCSGRHQGASNFLCAAASTRSKSTTSLRINGPGTSANESFSANPIADATFRQTPIRKRKPDEALGLTRPASQRNDGRTRHTAVRHITCPVQSGRTKAFKCELRGGHCDWQRRSLFADCHHGEAPQSYIACPPTDTWTLPPPIDHAGPRQP